MARVSSVHCTARRSTSSAEEYNPETCFVFPQRGVFFYYTGTQWIVADPTSVVFLGRSTSYRIAHPSEEGDECLTLRPSNDIIDAALLDLERRIDTIVLSAVRLRNIRLMFLILQHTPDMLAKDEIAVSLLREISGDRFKQKPGPTCMKAVNEVRALLAERPEEAITLSQIGQHVRLSPYHLARLFQRATGTSIHRYRLQIRLAIALSRLRSGWTDIASLATDLGFSHHSHFSAAFRKMYGFAPSALRNVDRIMPTSPRETRIRASR